MCRYSRCHHFKHCENVHKVDDVSLVNKKHKQSVGACDKEEENAKGRIVLRTKRAVIRPGDIVYVGKKKYIVASSKNLGKQLKLADGSLLTTSKVTKIIHCGGWKTVTL